MSYLSQHKMCVRCNGPVSAEQDIPGGGPQGGLLTVIFFDLQVDLAGAQEHPSYHTLALNLIPYKLALSPYATSVI